MRIRFNKMLNTSLLICWTVLVCLFSINAQECSQPLKEGRFNCYPEDNPNQDKCRARGCCWNAAYQPSNLSNYQALDVPPCYYPSNFTSYKIMSNEPTDIGQEIQLYKPRGTYLPNDIFNLTVEIIYETQQRLRIRIRDSYYRRYQVPLQVPKVSKKADPTDYDVELISEPFAIIVTRKSTNETL